MRQAVGERAIAYLLGNWHVSQGGGTARSAFLAARAVLGLPVRRRRSLPTEQRRVLVAAAGGRACGAGGAAESRRASPAAAQGAGRAGECAGSVDRELPDRS